MFRVKFFTIFVPCSLISKDLFEKNEFYVRGMRPFIKYVAPPQCT